MGKEVPIRSPEFFREPKDSLMKEQTFNQIRALSVI